MAVKLLFAQIYIACVIRSGFFPPRFAASSQQRAAFLRCTKRFRAADVQVTHYILW